MKTLQVDPRNIGAGIELLEAELRRLRVSKKHLPTSILAAEELMVKLAVNMTAAGFIQLSVSSWLGEIHVSLSCAGHRIVMPDASPAAALESLVNGEAADEAEEDLIRDILLRSMRDRIRFRYKNNCNIFVLTVEKSKYQSLWLTLGAFALAIVFAVFVRWITPAAWVSGLSECLLSPVKTMFLNSLKMVTAPVVFFSIVSCIAGLGNMSELGKIGGKVMGLYVLTTWIAIGIGIGLSFLLQPGSPDLLANAAAAKFTAKTVDISIIDTITAIVPANFVEPFVKSDMLQIIFLAVFCGVAVGRIGKYSRPLQDIFEACNTLFLQVTTMIIKFVPIAVFCSVSLLLLKTGTETLFSLAGMVGVILLGMALMTGVYCVMIALIARLNPFVFLRKYAPAMLTTFSLGSSNAAMPVNLRVCRNSLGISDKICSFSIPLGATVNMDGSCVYMAVAALFLARIYGVAITSANMMAMVFSIFVLSVGAPGIPGSGLICLSVLLVQIGIPVESIGLIDRHRPCHRHDESRLQLHGRRSRHAGCRQNGEPAGPGAVQQLTELMQASVTDCLRPA